MRSALMGPATIAGGPAACESVAAEGVCHKPKRTLAGGFLCTTQTWRHD